MLPARIAIWQHQLWMQLPRMLGCSAQNVSWSTKYSHLLTRPHRATVSALAYSETNLLLPPAFVMMLLPLTGFLERRSERSVCCIVSEDLSEGSFSVCLDGFCCCFFCLDNREDYRTGNRLESSP